MRSVLLIAFHYPPVQGSSGVQRTLRFSQHLPKFGWKPIILSIDSQAYEATSHGEGNEVPPDVDVHRVFGLDAGRQLSILGRYPRRLALPDRWATWRFRAIPSALRIIREAKIGAIWSTFPIATAHSIGLVVARRSGLPWIAEFRDPMWQGDYPSDPVTNRSWRRLEEQIFGNAKGVVVTTPGAVSMYADRFPQYDKSRIVMIQNGYDEQAFRRAEAQNDTNDSATVGHIGPLTLLHSGVVYRSERDPTQLFAALAEMKERGAVTASDLRVIFRASGNEHAYRQDVDRFRINDIVHLEPPIDYLSALREMLVADGLLILQAANCNSQIPAKLYEYIRARRPILALTDPAGDTARTLDDLGVGLMARLDSRVEIKAALTRFIAEAQDGTWRRASGQKVAQYSRESQAGELARLLDHLAG